MAERNQLLFLIFICSVELSGCGSLTTGPDRAVFTRPVPGADAAARAPSNPAPAMPADDENEMLLHALMAAGVDYRNGCKSYQSGFDCSGLVAHVFSEAYGLALPHNTKAQSELGDPVDQSQLQPGDLVFFNTLRKPYSHVGIYVGEGRFIHAPKQGAVVRTESLTARYWATRYDGARRVVPTLVTVDFQSPAKKPVITRP